jgi:archaellum component FlaC
MVGCMVVIPRETWTDEKLDKAFGRIDGDLRELRVEMRKGFEKIDQRFEEMDRRFDHVDKRFEQVDKRFEQIDRRFEGVDARFDAVQRNMFIGLVTINATLITGLLAIRP